MRFAYTRVVRRHFAICIYRDFGWGMAIASEHSLDITLMNPSSTVTRNTIATCISNAMYANARQRCTEAYDALPTSDAAFAKEWLRPESRIPSVSATDGPWTCAGRNG